MAQADNYVVEDVDGATFLVDINTILAAIATINAGGTEPTTTYAYMLWADTGSGKLKQRNAANDAWVEKGNLADVDWGFLNKAGGSMAGLFNQAAGADIASAATVDLTAATGNCPKVTGTTPVSAWTMNTGQQMVVIAGGALPLTYHATTNNIEGGGSYTCTAGDLIFLVKGLDGVIRVRIKKQDGTPVVGTGASIIGDSKNLIITNNAGTPNSQVDIDADEIILKDSSGRAYLAEAVNLTANIATSGANGLDTGVEANSTWYYLWVIYNGTTVASLISTSSTAPTLPSGYTYKALMGAIYNGSGGDFIKYYQTGQEFWIGETTLTSTVPTLSYVALSLSSSVPPTAKSARITLSYSGSASNTTIYVAPTSSDNLSQKKLNNTGATTTAGFSQDKKLPLIEAQTLYYKRTGDAIPAGSIYCNGGEY